MAILARVFQVNRTHRRYIYIYIYIYQSIYYLPIYLSSININAHTEREKERDLERERNLLQELAHVIMEAEKSYNLPSASWRIRKASSTIQFKAKGLRNRSWWFKSVRGQTALRLSSSNIQGQKNWTSQLRKRERIWPSLTFCSIQALKSLDDAHPHCWGCLLYSVYWIKW